VNTTPLEINTDDHTLTVTVPGQRTGHEVRLDAETYANLLGAMWMVACGRQAQEINFVEFGLKFVGPCAALMTMYRDRREHMLIWEADNAQALVASLHLGLARIASR
jgi:hypothetical protein